MSRKERLAADCQGRYLRHDLSIYQMLKSLGIDLNEFKDIDNDRIKTSVCNQESKKQLNSLINKIGSEFNLIVDIAGHTKKQNQISIYVLIKHLGSGGGYVIKDLHSCEIPQYVKDD